MHEGQRHTYFNYSTNSYTVESVEINLNDTVSKIGSSTFVLIFWKLSWVGNKEWDDGDVDFYCKRLKEYDKTRINVGVHKLEGGLVVPADIWGKLYEWVQILLHYQYIYNI